MIMATALQVSSQAYSYEKFELIDVPENESLTEGDERVYAECTCYGVPSVMDSYPPQYGCLGYEYCRTANYTR